MKQKEILRTYTAAEIENYRDAGGMSATAGIAWAFGSVMLTLLMWDANWDWNEWGVAVINLAAGLELAYLGLKMLADADEEKARRRL